MGNDEILDLDVFLLFFLHFSYGEYDDRDQIWGGSVIEGSNDCPIYRGISARFRILSDVKFRVLLRGEQSLRREGEELEMGRQGMGRSR